MKRVLITLSLFGCLLLAESVNAQTAAAPTSTASSTTTGVAAPDTSQLKQYIGNYAVATGDVKQIIVTIERGKLVGEAVGLGQSSLLPDPTLRDAFTVPDPNGGSDVYGTVQFGRDATGTVANVLLVVQGQKIEGVRAN